MKFTFGIITDGDANTNLNPIVDSIEKQNIPEYEILIVGNNSISRKNTKVISFDESIKPKWITRKSNLITLNSKYDNIVYAHDYIAFEDGWYDGYLRYGDDFKVCCNKVMTLKNERYMDWMIWPFNGSKLDYIVSGGIESGHQDRECLIPYDITHLSKYMYVQGSYWVAKKEIMLKFPLDENKVWGMGEDVEWSMRYRNYPGNYFSINQRSTCTLLKEKKSVFKECSSKTIEKIKNFNYEL